MRNDFFSSNHHDMQEAQRGCPSFLTASRSAVADGPAAGLFFPPSSFCKGQFGVPPLSPVLFCPRCNGGRRFPSFVGQTPGPPTQHLEQEGRLPFPSQPRLSHTEPLSPSLFFFRPSSSVRVIRENLTHTLFSLFFLFTVRVGESHTRPPFPPLFSRWSFPLGLPP